MTDTIKIIMATVLIWAACLTCYNFGWYAQMYSTMPSDGYSTIYYEYSTPYTQIVMYTAALSRCQGQLEEDFSCSVPGDKGYEGSAA